MNSVSNLPSTSHSPSNSHVDLIGGELANGWRVGAILITLLLVNTFSQIDRILPFILSEAIKQELSLSDTQIGLMTGIAFAICYTLLSLPLARLADRGSPRMVLAVCVVVWSAMTAFGGIASNFVQLALTRLGVAFGEAGAVPAGHALIARKIKPERRGLAIGIFSMGFPLGTMLGFSVGGAISDSLGWRVALMGAGGMGLVIALLVLFVIGPTPALKSSQIQREPFLRSSLKLLASSDFRWLFAGAIAVGFASAPFYAFAGPFLIRTYGYTASEAGLTFGLMQGVLGLIGTVVGGRGFDRAVHRGSGLLFPPAILFLVASITTTAALFAPTGPISLALMVPLMASFAFSLPWGFGAAHMVAGPGNQALASSLVMIGAGLLGPALGPLIAGMVSDTATAAELPNGLALGLLIVPLSCALTCVAYLTANKRLATLQRRTAIQT